MNKVAIYCRKSVEDPKGNSVSIDEQKNRGARLAKQKFPKLKIEYYIDEGLSGKLPPHQWAKKGQKKCRPEFSRLIDDISHGKIRALVSRRVDRIARNMSIQQKFFDHLPRENFDLYFVDEPHLSHSTAEGKLQLNILSAIAEFERIKVETNVRAAKKYAKDNGLKMGSAYWVVGYEDSPDGKYTVHEEGRKAVVQIYDWFLDGVKYAEITRRLNEQYPDVHPPNNSDLWYQSTVKRILQSPRYIGKSPNSDGVLIDSRVYEPIVEKSKWNECAKKIEQLHGIHHRTDHGINIFGDVLVCGNCRSRLVLYSRYSRSGENLGREYKCINKQCDDRGVTLREDAFLDLIYSLFFWDIKQTEDESVKDELENLLTDLVGAKDAEAKVRKRLKTSTIFADDLLDIHEARLQVIKKLEARIEELRTRKTYKSFSGIRSPDEIDELEKREKVQYLIKRMSTHKNYVEIELNKPEECNEFLNALISRATQSPLQKELKKLLYPKCFRVPVMLVYRPSKKHNLCLVPERFSTKHTTRLGFHKWDGSYEVDWTTMSKFFPLAYNSFYFRNTDRNQKFISHKKCRQCEEVKPLYDPQTAKATFSHNKQVKDGWHSYCKSCTQIQRDCKKAEING